MFMAILKRTPDRKSSLSLPLLLVCMTMGVARADETNDAKQPAPTTRPLQLTPEAQVDLARRRAMLEVASRLLEDAPPEEYRLYARTLMRARRFEDAIVYDLIALKLKPKDPITEFDLALAFAGWKKPLAMKYFTAAAKDGYWGYPLVERESGLSSIKKEPGFDELLALVKENYEREAPNHPPGQTVKTPDAQIPKEGWPVIIFLHGWGSRRLDYEPVADMASKQGYLAIAVDSPDVMGPGAYEFAAGDVESAHAYVTKVLKHQKDKIDPARIFVAGFSQGAENAACLLAAHPEFYAGAIANSPGGKPTIPETLDAKTPRPLYLMLGSHESPITASCVERFEALCKTGDWPTDTLHFDGTHQFPPDALEAYRAALEWVAGRVAKP